ncbi:MAG TPA: ORF6N domain-containing protein [Verrucomicrobiae bacterium]|nr:ORF6N domain-containing protein [Verrucomicrobiae bacterium]
MSRSSVIPIECIEQQIFLLRGQKVMLSPHLAQLYGVEPKALIQAVKRSAERFPSDFAFQLTRREVRRLGAQVAAVKSMGRRRSGPPSVTLKRGEHANDLPYAFTEQGVAMLSSVLRSKRAVRMNVGIMQTFVRLRQWLASHAGLAGKLEELEKNCDPQFRIVFDAIRHLVSPSTATSREPIGFGVRERRAAYGTPLSSAALNPVPRRRHA